MRRAKVLPGLATATKTLADGSRRKYFYAWRGGPMLKDDQGVPLQIGDPRLVTAYADAHKARTKPTTGTLHSLIAAYRSTGEFTKLGERTKKDYQRFLGVIEQRFGTLPVAALAEPQARGLFKTWRDQIASAPPQDARQRAELKKAGKTAPIAGDRQADYAWGVLARVLSVAKDRGTIPTNPCERGGKLYEVDRAEVIWQPADIKAFGEVAPDELRLALVLALWTGQRQGDLIKLTWSQYDGTHIRLRQGKRKARVLLPVGSVLKTELDSRRPEKPTGAILRNTYGDAWTSDGFRSSWGTVHTRAGLDTTDLRFNDLRGTAVTRLALAGCSVPQIAGFTGHSLKDVERILNAHYLGGKFELAEQAMLKLERHISLQAAE
jgi:integrase